MSYLFDPANWEWLFGGPWLRFLLYGFFTNLEIAVIAMALSLAFGLSLALLALSKNRWIARAARTWIDVWRNLPLIFVILYVFITMPETVKEWYGGVVPDFFPDAFDSPAVLAAVIALTLYNSAVIAEIMRAGIVSLEKGQGEAAAALGLPYWKSMRLVILPQGLRRMVPATVSQLITLNKDTTLVSIITVQEVMRRGRIVTNTAGNPFADPGGTPAPLLMVFLTIGVMFIIVNFGLSRLSRRLEIRERQRTGTKVGGPTGLEDQVALDADVA
jgi:glutamate transport system permease protein